VWSVATEPNHYIVITAILGQFRNEDVDAVMDEITEMAGEDTSIGRKVARPSLGARIPDVLHVATNGAEAYVGGQIAAAAGRLAKRLWQRRKERSEDPGEVGVIIYGPKGEELARVVSKAPDGEPEHYEGRMVPLGYRVGDVEWKRGPKAKEPEE